VRKFYSTIGLAKRQWEIPENIGAETSSKNTIITRITTKVTEFFQNQNLRGRNDQLIIFLSLNQY
jgi:hypothetical protein